MAVLIKHSIVQFWRLLHLRSGLFASMDALMVFAGNWYSFVLLSISVLLSVAGGLAIRFWQVSRMPATATIWFLTAGLLDLVAGLALLIYVHQPKQGIILILGAWGILVGLIQAVEAMYVFIGLQTLAKSKDSSATLIHFLNVLICGGIAFMLVLQPTDGNSTQIVGWFFIVLSIALLILTRRLQIDEGAASSTNDALPDALPHGK